MLLCCAETMTIMPQLDVRSIGIQCNLLAVPPLKKLQCKDDITEESLPSEAEETDLHLFSLFTGRYYNRVSTNSSTLINI